MKIFTSLLILALMLLTLGCSSLSVKTDYDRDVDFSTFKLYRWAAGKEVNPDDELSKNPLLNKRIQNAIDKVLSEKGFTIGDNDDVDFIVLVHAGVKEKMQVTDWGYRGWYDPWWGPYGGRVDVSYYEEGTLVIDVVSTKEKELVWRGLGTGIIRDTEPEEQEERFYRVVSKILAEFPPNN